MYLLILVLGVIAISILGLLIRRQIRPVLCRFLAALLALAAFVSFPILEAQITEPPSAPDFTFHEADASSSGPAQILQVFAVDAKGFLVAQEIPVREAQTLSIPLDVYGSVELKIDPDQRRAKLLDRKTRLLSIAKPFNYMRNRLTQEEFDRSEAERKAGIPWIEQSQPLNEKFFDTWQHCELVPLCPTKNARVRLSWRLIRPQPQATFDLNAQLEKYEAMILSKAQLAKLLGSAHRQTPDTPSSLNLLMTSHRYLLVLLLAGFALFIALPFRLPLALPSATLVSLLFLLAIDDQNWRQAQAEIDPVKSWRMEQQSLFFSRGEVDIRGFEKILNNPSTQIMRQVTP
ncbi:MAG: hypothetical protein RL095_3811 [Verrucomicrobiota bacterium]|jgi:hypothetical protein